MRNGLMMAALAALLLSPFPAKAQESFNYPLVLHDYWKLAPPSSYGLFAESYAKEFPDVVPAGGDEAAIAETIAKTVKEADASVPVVMTLNTYTGTYSTPQKAFVYAPFTSNVFVPVHPTQIGSNLPEIQVRFLNGPRIRSLPATPEQAKKFPGFSDNGGRYLTEVTFIPKKASALSKELKGTITSMVLRVGQQEIAKLTFDPETGEQLSSEILYDKAQAPEGISPNDGSAQ